MSKKVEVSSGSPERFGYEWVNYSSLENDYEKQFQRWIPFVSPAEWKELRFLDVGCGMGRNCYWPLSYGAVGGVGIDVNLGTLDSAKKTLKNFSNAEVKYCSAYEIKESNEFDIVYSIGVIHHLEYPELALRNMVNASKSLGRVAIWVYGYENNEWIVRFFNPLRKALFSKLPIAMTHHLSLYPTIFLYIFLKLFNHNIEYYRMLKDFSFKHLRSIVFDQMLPKIANYWKKNEVENIMLASGLTNIEVRNVNDMSWAAIGTKP